MRALRVLVRLIGIAACATLAACATPYQRSGFSGGYTDYRAGANTIYVAYKGNGYTSEETVTRYWHMRAAEVCGGEDRYEVVSRDNDSSTQTWSSGETKYSATATSYGNQTYVHGTAKQSAPIVITKYGAHGYVRCVHGGSYDARRSIWGKARARAHGRNAPRESSPAEEEVSEMRAAAYAPPRPVAARAPVAPAAEGCQYDTQCKGDRICQAGLCVDPPAPAAPIDAPAAP